MFFVAIASWIVTLIAVAFAVKFYTELHKWARQCQGARIAIAYKTKVKLHAPLTEWLAWVNMLDKDKASTGRVVYQMGGTSVAITKRVSKKDAKTVKPESQKRVRTGSWSSHDETPEVNHARN